MFAADAASRALGIRLLASGPGSATAAVVVTETMLNGQGSTHGGHVFLLADTAFAVACNAAFSPTVAAAASITFLAPTGLGGGRRGPAGAPTGLGDELVAEAVERVRQGRSGICDVTVRCGDRVVAEFRGNSREVHPRAQRPE
jgi:acyl-CoA thioesterase